MSGKFDHVPKPLMSTEAERWAAGVFSLVRIRTICDTCRGEGYVAVAPFFSKGCDACMSCGYIDESDDAFRKRILAAK